MLLESVGSLNVTRASVRKPTYKDFYVNLKSSVTQWTLPYHLRTFSNADIEIESFISQLLQRDVFSRSPLIEMTHLAPKDLWPNADILYKQILANEEKARKAFADLEPKPVEPLVVAVPKAVVEVAAVVEGGDGSPRKKKGKKKGKRGSKKSKSSGDGSKPGTASGRPASRPVTGDVEEEGDNDDDDDDADADIDAEDEM